MLQNFQEKLVKVVLKKNYNYFEKSNNFRLNNIQPSDSQVVYGSASKGLQFISNTDKKNIRQKFGISAITDNQQQSYNTFLPHYVFALALFKSSLKGFLTNEDAVGGEASHGMMHLWLGSVLDHGSFSITSLLFFPYHGWIDAQVEIAIRRGNLNSYTYSDIQKYIDGKSYADSPRSTTLFPSQISQDQKIQSMSEWHLSSKGKIDSSSKGYYPIVEWINWNSVTGTSPQVSSAFCSRDYILTNKSTVRTSLDFNDIYKSPNYKALTKKRYYFFDNLDQFNYNYDYQLGSTKDDLQTILNSTGTNLPNYLKELQIHFNQRIVSSTEQARIQFGGAERSQT